MSGLWIDACIMKLKRTPAEKLLLARICYRAGIAKDGLCRDSNKDLSLAIGIHAQSVSDLVGKFEKDGLLKATVDETKANARAINPISQILTPYKENADRYKEKTDSDYKEIPYSTPETEPALSGNSLDPISQILTPYKEITYSLYKDIKPLENSDKTFLKTHTLFVADRDEMGVRFQIQQQLNQKKKKKPPQLPPAPPEFPPDWPDKLKSLYLDQWLPYRQSKRSAGKLLPASIQAQVDALGELTQERAVACINFSLTNGYTGLILDKFKTPHGNQNQQPAKARRIEPVPGQSFGKWTGSRFSNTDANGRDKTG